MDYSACLANSDRVTISYARSGGPGGQNVNKVNTKVDMRFNVKNADWLSERVRERIIQIAPMMCYPALCSSRTFRSGMKFMVASVLPMSNSIFSCEKNLINKDGEIVISSTKTRAQKGNTEDAKDALAKLQLFTY